MNHESSGCPLPLAQANKPRAFSPPHSNTTHMPTSWQGIPTSSVPPRKWKRRFHWTHSWGMGTTRGLVTAGTSGIPRQKKGGLDPNLAQIPGQNDAYANGSYADTSPSLPPQGKTPEPVGRIYATKLLPQGHYVSPVYLPGANCQQRGIKMNLNCSYLEPRCVSLRPEGTTKPRDTSRSKAPGEGALWEAAGTMPASRGKIKVLS